MAIRLRLACARFLVESIVSQDPFAGFALTERVSAEFTLIERPFAGSILSERFSATLKMTGDGTP